MLAVENIGKFGESILIQHNFTYQSVTLHTILLCDPDYSINVAV